MKTTDLPFNIFANTSDNPPWEDCILYELADFIDLLGIETWSELAKRMNVPPGYYLARWSSKTDSYFTYGNGCDWPITWESCKKTDGIWVIEAGTRKPLTGFNFPVPWAYLSRLSAEAGRKLLTQPEEDTEAEPDDWEEDGPWEAGWKKVFDRPVPAEDLTFGGKTATKQIAMDCDLEALEIKDVTTKHGKRRLYLFELTEKFDTALQSPADKVVLRNPGGFSKTSDLRTGEPRVALWRKWKL